MRYYKRKISLLIKERGSDTGIDLSDLRISFECRKGDTSSPNEAYITIYNLSKETRSRIRTGIQDVYLSAGYEDCSGLIFTGTIRNFWIGGQWGIESEITPTDNMLTITCADGDRALKQSVVCACLSKKSTSADQIAVCCDSLRSNGVGIPNAAHRSDNPLPRSKCLFGPVQDILSQIADSCGESWSIQDGFLEMHKKNTELSGQSLDVSSASGMVGAPKLGNNYVEFSTLLDSRIHIGTNVTVHNVNDSTVTARVITVVHKGDTHSNDWTTQCKAMITDRSSEEVLHGS